MTQRAIPHQNYPNLASIISGQGVAARPGPAPTRPATNGLTLGASIGGAAPSRSAAVRGTPTPAATGGQQEKAGLRDRLRSIMSRPEMRAALMQFGVSLLSPGTTIGSSIGDAAGAAGRYGTLQRERTQQEAADKRTQEAHESGLALREEQTRLAGARADALGEPKPGYRILTPAEQSRAVPHAPAGSRWQVNEGTGQITELFSPSSASKTYRPATPEERTSTFADIPEDTYIQVGSDGSVKFMNAGSRDDESMRDRKIQDYIQMFTERGMERKQAENMAIAYADNKASITVSTDGNRTIYTNDLTHESIELPITGGAANVPAPGIAPAETLDSFADYATGVGSGVQSLIARFPGANPTELQKLTEETRTKFKTFSNKLIASLVNNPRFAAFEVEFLRNSFGIEPELYDNPGALRARMQSVADSIEEELRFERFNAADPNLDKKARATANRTAKEMEFALAKIGMPRRSIPEKLTPEYIAVLTPLRAKAYIDSMTDAEIDALPEDSYQSLMQIMRSGRTGVTQ